MKFMLIAVEVDAVLVCICVCFFSWRQGAFLSRKAFAEVLMSASWLVRK
ncbi:MAG: hypothetical protein VB133_08870 [Anaeromusa sp.]|nr:hypothetical protein [Anaeromusa sp.]MEA4835233.1 hypothetical protein [Anaeromusa sp.]